MSDPKKKWEEVGDKLSALGIKLKLHTEEETAEDGKEFNSALDRLSSTIKDVFDGLSDAAKDPAVREDARGIATAFADAVDATIADAKRRIQR